jgi:hypothetical protein
MSAWLKTKHKTSQVNDSIVIGMSSFLLTRLMSKISSPPLDFGTMNAVARRCSLLGITLRIFFSPLLRVT